MVGGVPIGDAEYVRAVMDQQATEICELIENTATELQSKPHAFWSCLYYWLRHMPPRQTIGAAARVDRALLTAAYSLGYDSIFEDQLTLRRLRLPARMRGCGIRSRVWLAPIAYAASFIEAAEATAAAKAGWAGVLCGEQASGSQEEEDRKR